ncbi:hypothetical protein OG21DRAFT_1535374 [Imleria badia]|nr:hypothetical protein OG21DRAFT_1535374 [Imleria badia]
MDEGMSRLWEWYLWKCLENNVRFKAQIMSASLQSREQTKCLDAKTENKDDITHLEMSENLFEEHEKTYEVPLLPVELVQEFIRFARDHGRAVNKNDNISPTITSLSFPSLGFKRDAASSATSYSYPTDPHAVSTEEALSYYAGLPSQPALIYRTGKEQWSPPKGPEAYRRLKELCQVFAHPIIEVWNDELGWKVVSVMDAHQIRFTTIDIVRFKKVVEDDEEGEAKNPVVGPVTIWIGVSPDTTSATAAHGAAQDVLALLKDYKITDVDVDFRESAYVREVGPRLHRPVGDLDPLVDVVGPLTPALGLGISTNARLGAQGTMAVYIAEGGDNDRLLGLTCRHVLISSKDTNVDYVYHPSAPTRDVLLGKRAFNNLVDSIKVRIGRHGIAIKRWRSQIAGFKRREQGTDAADVAKARADRGVTQGLVNNAEAAMDALGELLNQVNQDWNQPNNRVLGHVLRSPAIALGVGPHRFTEDYGILQVNRDKLGEGFQGNKIDLDAFLTIPPRLRTKLDADEFTLKCYPHADADWKFRFPDDRLLPLTGTISDDLMRHPDMWDLDGELCLLVVKNGNATGTTIGRANGVFSIVRDYFNDPSINQTSMEWGIINYDSKSEVFSKAGDSGSIIADIRGRIGGMLTGGSGKTESSDMTYATPFWWLLERIQANGFPNAHLNVVA